MAYKVEIAQLPYTPLDISEPIKVECVVYDGEEELGRENIVYDGGITDDALLAFCRGWAEEYVNRSDKAKDKELLTMIGEKMDYESSPEL